MQIRLDGARALVTGAAGGIGLETVKLLRDAGAEVWLADLAEREPQEVARTLGVQGLELDVRDAVAVERALDAARGPSIVVANAGIAPDAKLEETSQEMWDRTLGINLTGAFLTVREAGRRMKAQGGGAIVLTASTNSFDGERWLTAYNASKHGLMGILHTAANELGPFGVRVNAVCPGFIRTRLTAAGFDDPGFMKEYTRHLPMGRGGEAVEVARAIVFLASPLASYITGAHLFVDGGQMAAKFGIWDEEIGAFRGDHWELRRQ
jgi:NAD(P)-dependent dehydrogenase (short-subunit alcohol dehydrogenase family)